MEEIWKDVAGYEGYYQVSNLGRIRHIKFDRLLKLCCDSYGYLIVVLSKGGIHRTRTVHRLVAKAFIPNESNYVQVNHKDENKQNNCVENLEWCDNKYNCNYGKRNKKISKKVSKNVIQLSTSGKKIKKWNSITEAAKFLGCNISSISMCCNGKRRTAGGYRWEYVK